jgi:hypothetical protein
VARRFSKLWESHPNSLWTTFVLEIFNILLFTTNWKIFYFLRQWSSILGKRTSGGSQRHLRVCKIEKKYYFVIKIIYLTYFRSVYNLNSTPTLGVQSWRAVTSGVTRINTLNATGLRYLTASHCLHFLQNEVPFPHEEISFLARWAILLVQESA